MRVYRPSVGIVLVGPDRRILCGKRLTSAIDSSWNRPWQMPQGGIQEGELPLRAAKRELAEETGVSAVEVEAEYPDWIAYDFPSGVGLRVFEGRFIGQRQKWFLMSTRGDSQANICLQSGDGGEPAEFEDWAWLTPEEVLARCADFRKPTYEKVLCFFFPGRDLLR